MKNTPIELEASAAWRACLVRFDEDLRRRGAAEKTRSWRIADVRQFAGWATWQRIQPAAVTGRALQRYAAALGASYGGREQGRAAPATVNRKLASLRSFFAMLVEHGAIASNPIEAMAMTGRSRGQAGALTPEQVSALLDRISVSTPLELRDRALFELAYATGLRADDLVSLDVASVDVGGGRVCVERRGFQTRVVPTGEPALAALARYLERARTALSGGDGEAALFLSKSGRRLSTSDVRRRLGAWARYASIQGGVHGGVAGSARGLVDQSSTSPTPIYTRVESARLKAAYSLAHPRA